MRLAIILLLVTPFAPSASTISFVWNPVPDAVAYRLYWGPSADKMIGVMDCQANRATFDNAQRGTFWRVTAVNSLGLESEFSDPCGHPDDEHKGRRRVVAISASRRR